MTISAKDKLAKPMKPEISKQILTNASSLPVQKTQLPLTLNLAIGMTIELSLNICTEDGLTNGVSGLVACLPSSAIVSDANTIVWI